MSPRERSRAASLRDYAPSRQHGAKIVYNYVANQATGRGFIDATSSGRCLLSKTVTEVREGLQLLARRAGVAISRGLGSVPWGAAAARLPKLLA